ncbi:RNA polymerase sigma factor [Planotetraspora phitsanulokensis]|uniref:DNA-directed RNA polymerase sigma-70 factor n=1 Tax=Planotetraspora phitsanulokensis TaxID=575192 RepID=A0A8J3UC52_9ACTN|nr:sigma-70 family RNA polymerase sigma factor [Planotetraspora phitsanulokensis]GII42100.1 DNA-directed RNA polymerase sigma-70 factor [Planotetraspora phitsanulokensis]
MSDEAGFTSMFQEHYESVLRYAWRRVGPADAPDVAAETFRVAWEKYDRFPHDQPLPWLYTTARNLTLNLIRRDNRRDALVDSLSDDVTRNGAEEDHAGTFAARQAALAALNSLSDGDRELVLLMSWEGLDLRQAAAVVGCSRSTAAMRLHRIRKRLRHLLVEESQPIADRQPSFGRSVI